MNDNDKPCRYYIQDKCKFGKDCRFSHKIIKCYLLRHAQSHYNQALESFVGEKQSLQAKKGFQTNKRYIDSGINDKGLSQIEEIKFPPQFEDKRIKFNLIFVSPMNRCLKTAQRCIKKHKIKYNKVIVFPLITQVLSKICDFSKSIQQKKSLYPSFDFSYFQKNQQKQWQDNLVDPEFKNKINNKLENAQRYLQILNEIFPQPLENSKRCFNRAIQAVKQMKRISQEEGAKEIFVISHNRVIKYILGRYNEGRHPSIGNCQLKLTYF